MSVPSFDANRYPHADTVSGAFPQQRPRGEGGPMRHGNDAGAGSTSHGGDTQTGSTDHGSGQAGSIDHGGEPQTGPSAHDGDVEPEPTDDSRNRARSSGQASDSFLGLSNRGFTVATGYVATGLLALTLLIGPANLLLRRRNPVSSYLRRDVGTWTAMFSVVHMIYGLQVHRRLRDFLDYFLAPDGSALTNSFGLANWTGLAALVIVMGLLVISSDFALRKLKARRWKQIQRLNYALFALVIAHAFFYGALLRTDSPYTLLLVVTVIAVVAGQAVGIWLWRRRHTGTPTSQHVPQPAGGRI